MFAYMKQKPGFYRQVVMLALPIVLQNLITSALGMADTFMVGMLGEVPMAAVTLANIPLFALQMFIFGVQSGSSVLVSQYWGKQEMEAINRVLGVALWVVLVVSALFAGVLLVCPVEFLSLFGNEPEVIALAAQYGSIAGLSYVCNAFTMMYVAAYRSMERPKLGLYILVASMAINTFLNWVLIFGKLGCPALGIEGAAIATVIARGIEFSIALFYILRMEKKIGYTLGHFFRYDRSFIRDFAVNVTPVILNELAWSLGNSMVLVVMGRMGRDFVTANTITQVATQVVQVFIIGLSNATAVIIGNSIGAGERQRTWDLARSIVVVGAAFGAMAAALMLLLRGPFISLYNVPEATKALTSQVMASAAFIIFFQSHSFIGLMGILRGGGDNRFVLFCEAFFLWGVAIPAGFAAGLWLGLPAPLVYIVLRSDEIIKNIVGLPRIWGGKWIRDVTR